MSAQQNALPCQLRPYARAALGLANMLSSPPLTRALLLFSGLHACWSQQLSLSSAEGSGTLAVNDGGILITAPDGSTLRFSGPSAGSVACVGPTVEVQDGICVAKSAEGSPPAGGVVKSPAANPDWVLALFFEGPDGSTGVIDSSLYAHTATVTGSEAITTAQQAPRLRSTASLACSAGGYVQYAASSDFKFGTSDWAIEADFLHDATPTASYTDLISVGTTEVDNPDRIHFSFNNGQVAVYKAASWTDTGYTPPVGSWWHARLERKYGLYLRLLVDGQVPHAPNKRAQRCPPAGTRQS